MKILVCAAGSAGHIYPAFGFIDGLKKQLKNPEIIFLTSQEDVRRDFFKDAGFRVAGFAVRGLPRRNGSNYLIFCLKIFCFLIKFISESFRILFLINDIRPDTVVGFGGLICVVPVLAARIRGIPAIIHEQNILPGRAVRFLSRFADKTAVAFAETKSFLRRENVYCTGSIIAAGLRKTDRRTARSVLGLDHSRFTLFAFGGSQGAEFINKCLPQALEKFSPEQRSRIQVMHAAGSTAQAEILKRRYRGLQVKALVLDYIFGMSDYYCAADLVISRSGAGTLNELNFFGRAAILIPYPYAGSHQLKNAEFMEAKNAAVVITQDNDCPDRLYRTIDRLREERLMTEQMSKASARLFKADAVNSLVNLVLTFKDKDHKKRL